MPEAAVPIPPELWKYDAGGQVIGVCSAFLAFSVFIVPIRFWARRRKKIPWKWDDWLILISLPLLWSIPILAFVSVAFGGVGKPLVVNLAEDQGRFGRCLLYLFIGELTYGTVLSTIKISVLLMYYRIFPTRFMKIGGFILGGMTMAWWIAVIFVSIFQCIPVEKTWHPFMEGGHCLKLTDFFLGNAIPNIVTDMMILLLPVYEIRRLQVPKPQKIAIGSIFLVGGIVVVISCIRLKAIFDMMAAGDNVDFTRLIGPCWMWTTIEPVVALLCACMPTMQPLLKIILGRYFAGTSKGESDNSGIMTIGGSAAAAKVIANRNRASKSNRHSTFSRLHDDESDEGPVLWPQGHHNERDIMVEGKRSRSSKADQGIPLDSIAVQKDVTWTETHPVNRD